MRIFILFMLWFGLSLQAQAGIEFFCQRLDVSGDAIKMGDNNQVFGRLNRSGGLLHVFPTDIIGQNRSNLVLLGPSRRDGYASVHESLDREGRDMIVAHIPWGVWGARSGAHFTMSLKYDSMSNQVYPMQMDFACEVRNTGISDREITPFTESQYEFYEVCKSAANARWQSQCRIGTGY